MGWSELQRSVAVADPQLGGGAHERATAEVSTNHGAVSVGHRDVQVGTIARQGAAETEDLQVSAWL